MTKIYLTQTSGPYRFRYSFICQGTSTRRQRSDLFGLRVAYKLKTIKSEYRHMGREGLNLLKKRHVIFEHFLCESRTSKFVGSMLCSLRVYDIELVYMRI